MNATLLLGWGSFISSVSGSSAVWAGAASAMAATSVLFDFLRMGFSGLPSLEGVFLTAFFAVLAAGGSVRDACFGVFSTPADFFPEPGAFSVTAADKVISV